jgi:hypothetical protein
MQIHYIPMVFLDSAAAAAAVVVVVVVVVAAAAAAAYEFPIVLNHCGAICLPRHHFGGGGGRRQRVAAGGGGRRRVFGVGWGWRVPPPTHKIKENLWIL